MTRVPWKDSQEVRAGRAFLTNSVTSTNVARSLNTSPCISNKAHLLLTAAGPGTSGKGAEKRVFSFQTSWTRDAWPLQELACQQRDCVGFKVLEMSKPSLTVYQEHLLFTTTYCLPAGKVAIAQARVEGWGTFQWKCSGGSFTTDSAVISYHGCCEGPSAPSSTLPHSLDSLVTEMESSSKCPLSLIYL